MAQNSGDLFKLDMAHRLADWLVGINRHSEAHLAILAVSLLAEVTFLLLICCRDLRSIVEVGLPTDALLVSILPQNNVIVLVGMTVLIVAMMAWKIKLTILRCSVHIVLLLGLSQVFLQTSVTGAFIVALISLLAFAIELENIDGTYVSRIFLAGPPLQYRLLMSLVKGLMVLAAAFPTLPYVRLGIVVVLSMVWIVVRMRLPYWSLLCQQIEMLAAVLCLSSATLGIVLSLLSVNPLQPVACKLIAMGCLIVGLLVNLFLRQRASSGLVLTEQSIQAHLVETLRKFQQESLGPQLQDYCKRLLKYYREEVPEDFQLKPPTHPVTVLNKHQWMLFVHGLATSSLQVASADGELLLNLAYFQFGAKQDWRQALNLLELIENKQIKSKRTEKNRLQQLIFVARARLLREQLRSWVVSQHRDELKFQFRELTYVDRIISTTLEVTHLYAKLWKLLGEQEGFIDNILELSKQISRHMRTLDGMLSGLKFRSKHLTECLSVFDNMVRVDRARARQRMQDYEKDVHVELLTPFHNIVPMSMMLTSERVGQIFSVGLNKHLIGFAETSKVQWDLSLLIPEVYRTTHDRLMRQQVQSTDKELVGNFNKQTFVVASRLIKLVETNFHLTLLDDGAALIGFLKVTSLPNDILLLVETVGGAILGWSEQAENGLFGDKQRFLNWGSILNYVSGLDDLESFMVGSTNEILSKSNKCRFSVQCLKRFPVDDIDGDLMLVKLSPIGNNSTFGWFGQQQCSSFPNTIRSKETYSTFKAPPPACDYLPFDGFLDARGKVEVLTRKGSNNSLARLLIGSVVVLMMLKLAGILMCSINSDSLQEYMNLVRQHSLTEWLTTRSYLQMHYIELRRSGRYSLPEVYAAQSTLRKLVANLSALSDNSITSQHATDLHDIQVNGQTAYRANSELMTEASLSNFKVIAQIDLTSDPLSVFASAYDFLEGNRKFVLESSTKDKTTLLIADAHWKVMAYRMQAYIVAGFFWLGCLVYLLVVHLFVRNRQLVRQQVFNCFCSIRPEEIDCLQLNLERYHQYTMAIPNDFKRAAPIAMPRPLLTMLTRPEELYTDDAVARNPEDTANQFTEVVRPKLYYKKQRSSWLVYLLFCSVVVVAVLSEASYMFFEYSSSSTFDRVQQNYPNLHQNIKCASTIVETFFNDVTNLNDSSAQLKAHIQLYESVKGELVNLQQSAIADSELQQFNRLLVLIMYSNFNKYCPVGSYNSMLGVVIDNVLEYLFQRMLACYQQLQNTPVELLVYAYWLEETIQNLYRSVGDAFVDGNSQLFRRYSRMSNLWSLSTVLIGLLMLVLSVAVLLVSRATLQGYRETIGLIKSTEMDRQVAQASQ